MIPITSIFLERGNPELQDRAEILSLGNRLVLIVADGAGGISGGAQAADFFLRNVREVSPGLVSAQGCVELPRRLDVQIADAKECGETTGLVLVLGSAGLFGASVGDSAAWLFSANSKQDLTGGQARKPFLGGGTASPRPFAQNPAEGTLVVATDGLWKYTSLEIIEQRMRAALPEKLAAELADLVRLRSGTFPDDIAIVTIYIC